MAIEAFREAMERTEATATQHVEARKNLSHLYFETGAYASAAEMGMAQLEQKETYALRMFLAECAIAQTNRTDAITQLDGALALTDQPEQQGQIEFKKGYLYYDLGDFENANRSLGTAAQLLPGKVDRRKVARQLGYSALQQKAYKEAAEFFREFLRARFDEDVAVSYIEALAAAGELMAFRHDSFWQRMDTLRERKEIERLWQTDDAPWKVW